MPVVIPDERIAMQRRSYEYKCRYP